MSETLILLLGQSPDEPVRWGFINAGAVTSADVAQNALELSAIARRAAAARSVVAVLPGEQVAMRVMASPPRVTSKFKSAAMYLLEDELAESLESLHVAVNRRDDGAGAAFAVKKSLMDDWIMRFAEAGLSADVLTADYALLEQPKDSAIVVFEETRIVSAIGHSGLAGDRPLTDVLARRLVMAEEIESITAYGDAEAERFETGEKGVLWRGASDDASLFRLYAEGAESAGALNFLQGDYRKRRDWRAAIAPWRRAGALAAACIVGFISLTVADGVRSMRIADQLNAQAQSMHLAAFPEAQSANPRDFARRILSSGSAGPAFLPLTANFADSIGGEDAQIQIDRIRYNAARNEFSVNLSFAGINDLEVLKQDLAARGVSVEEVGGGVRRSNDRYVGELQVSAP